MCVGRLVSDSSNSVKSITGCFVDGLVDGTAHAMTEVWFNEYSGVGENTGRGGT